MNALQIIQATVEPEPGSQEIKVLRSACRRHGFPGPRFDPHGMTGATSRPGNYQCWVFGPHNMFMLVESRLDNDGEVLSHPWIRVLPNGSDAAASIVVHSASNTSAMLESLENSLDALLSYAQDPVELADFLRHTASMRKHNLDTLINNVFQARATVEPGSGRVNLDSLASALNSTGCVKHALVLEPGVSTVCLKVWLKTDATLKLFQLSGELHLVLSYAGEEVERRNFVWHNKASFIKSLADLYEKLEQHTHSTRSLKTELERYMKEFK